jgi:hypothetical protein
VRDFPGSTLWRISEFERIRAEMSPSGGTGLQRVTVFPTTLQAELQTLERGPTRGDPLEVISACQRQRESALIYLLYEEEFLWPVTLFPTPMLYHSPRDILQSTEAGLATLQLLSVEPPGVRPPGHWMHERVGQSSFYRPLVPLLWTLALQGPRRALLPGIGGTAAYRVLHKPEDDRLTAPGALGPAVERLRRQGASLKTIASWPGLGPDRSARLLNALYLVSNLIVSRAHPAARSDPDDIVVGTD